ncbi:hypothetical protein FDP70_12550, partial [Staphylococcus pseudintermedius]|nr:hypothetical protein [Staphylococcus pseudintermedius]
MNYDVIIIGAGPAGIYSSIILKRGIPTQNVEENISVGIIEKGLIGGFTRYAHIQISKQWSFSGSNLISNLYNEAKNLNVHFHSNEEVTNIEKICNDKFLIKTNSKIFTARFVILANGIFSTPESLNSNKVLIGLHNAKFMIEDIKEKGWKKIILYGSYKKSLKDLKKELEEYKYLEKIKIIVEPLGSYEKKFLDLSIPNEMMSNFDGIVIDYNSYKILNSSTPKINIPELKE